MIMDDTWMHALSQTARKKMRPVSSIENFIIKSRTDQGMTKTMQKASMHKSNNKIL